MTTASGGQKAPPDGELEVDDLDEAAELFLSMLKGISDLRCMVGVAPPIAPAERPARAARVVEHLRAMYRPER